MDIGKIMLAVCGLVLIVCLTLCITTLSALRNAVAENEAVQQNAALLAENLNGCVNELNEVLEKDASIEVSAGTTTAEKTETDAPTGFYLRETTGKIGVYTADGRLIEVLDVLTEGLPASDRQALADGIYAADNKELTALIQDYTT